MTDDIVTRLRKYLSHLDEYELTPLAYEAADEIERLRKIVKDLHHHLGEALYSDEWNTREYAIASYSRYEKEPF